MKFALLKFFATIFVAFIAVSASPTNVLEKRQCTSYNCLISSGYLSCTDSTGVTTTVQLTDPRLNGVNFVGCF
ncbi:hypothetical protein F8M41_001239 [Gigaspora margarita]|uniref:Uncharacterized protein n=1 Tax=Gigaspora margarita TaxID=4874 RepID=A0A8H3XH63_GIGMA|nr:hypothetical protein F8M41_001239 [Gigaspora margarita]